MEMDGIYYYSLGWMDGNGWNILLLFRLDEWKLIEYIITV